MNDDFDDLLNDELADKSVVEEGIGGESGEETVSGSSPSPTSDDDTASDLADVIGNEPESGKAFSMGDEIIEDEMRRHGLDPKEFGYGDDDEDEDKDDF